MLAGEELLAAQAAVSLAEVAAPPAAAAAYSGRDSVAETEGAASAAADATARVHLVGEETAGDTQVDCNTLSEAADSGIINDRGSVPLASPASSSIASPPDALLAEAQGALSSACAQATQARCDAEQLYGHAAELINVATASLLHVSEVHKAYTSRAADRCQYMCCW